MSDLVERLRRRAHSPIVAAHRENDRLHLEAAIEIERLRADLAKLYEQENERYRRLDKLTQESQAMGLYDPPFHNPMIKASDEASESKPE